MCMFNHHSDYILCMSVLKKTRFAHKGNIAIAIILYTVHDTENLPFSADDRAEDPHISARTISGFRADT